MIDTQVSTGAGDPANGVYVIETGLVKPLVLASGGRECLLVIHGPGDVFGELCLGGTDVVRQETAMAMEDTRLKATTASISANVQF